MTTTINASTSAGLVQTADTSGSLALQTASTTALTLDTSQNATFAGSVKTNTLTSAASTALTLQSAGTTAITIDTSQNVGIGTTSPAAKFNTSGSSAAGYIGNYFDNTASNGYVRVDLRIGSSGANGIASIKYAPGIFMQIGPDLNDTTTPLVFATNNATERARIDSSGNLLVGTTSAGSGATGGLLRVSKTSGNGIYSEAATTAAGYRYISNGLSDGGTFYHFNIQEGGTQRGSITSNGSVTLYNTTSDQRLKENIVDAGSGLEKLSNVKIRAFDWIENKIHTDFGVIAQELKTVAPEVVSKGCTEEDMMSVDTSALVPAMIKAIQELKAINDTQAETINALTARIVAIESKA